MSLRAAAQVRGRYGAILAYTGIMLLLAGLFAFVPLLALLVWPEEAWLATRYLSVAGLLGGTGGLLWWRLRPDRSITLSVVEGGVALLLAWLAVCGASALPFIGLQGLGVVHAVFESVSGWTTTGLSVVDVTEAPRTILLWRSVMQLGGGAGMAIILLVALGGPLGAGLAAAEGRSEQLVPQVRESARLVATIYAGLVLAGVGAYAIAGMSLFDAVNHAFAAVSTGGFSTRAESIGYWDSPAVEGVTIPLMILGSTNFQTTFLLLRRRFRAVARNGEVRVTGVLLVLSLAFLLALLAGLYPTLGERARVALFETVTALTTTGFSVVSYADWPQTAMLVQIALMIVGGHSGSTAGGIKQVRLYLLWKAVIWEVRRLLQPRSAVQVREVWQGESRAPVTESVLLQSAAFIAIWAAAIGAGTAVLTAAGHDLRAAAFEMASALGTVGLSVGVTSATAPSVVLMTETVAMLLGRLELLIVVVAIVKLGRDARTMLSAS